jgi:anti-anti-sigma factor
MPIIINKSKDDNSITLKIQGSFNIGFYTEFYNAIKDILPTRTRYIIDMTETDGIDSTGFGMLLTLRERAGGDNSDISIIIVNQSLFKLFQTYNFNTLFNVKLI